jgi:4-hydroxyphenylpyruvate dioxygenase
VARYLQRHAPGVVDLAFRVCDLGPYLDQAQQQGVPILAQQTDPLQNDQRWVTIQGWGSLHHTLIERSTQAANSPQSWSQSWLQACLMGASPSAVKIQFASPLDHVEGQSPVFTGIDHAVLNVEADQLQRAIAWYQDILGFQPQRVFDIQTNRSGLRSQVLIHPEGKAQLPINEPASTRSQVQEFLDCNGGAGIQHLALSTVEITKTVTLLRQRGLTFLEIPPTYYTQLRHQYDQEHPPLRIPLDLDALERQQILVDLQDPGQPSVLMQIFTQPIFDEPTFFLEIIERQAEAQGFGERNFMALFEAIEREQWQRGTFTESCPPT